MQTAKGRQVGLGNMRESANSNTATFVQSELFARTFREGMSLVEETANYLDGAGREASKSLSRSGALAYASASMRLTTQLMQIASWLLVMRAVREGEMSVDDAKDDKFRIKHRESLIGDMLVEGLPQALITLAEASGQLYGRIARIDADLFANAREESAAHDAAAQQRALLDAFGAGR